MHFVRRPKGMRPKCTSFGGAPAIGGGALTTKRQVSVYALILFAQLRLTGRLLIPAFMKQRTPTQTKLSAPAFIIYDDYICRDRSILRPLDNYIDCLLTCQQIDER